MAEERAAIGITGPVATRRVVGARGHGAVGPRAGQHVVLVRLVPASRHGLAFLGECRLLVEIVAVAFDVSVECRDVLRDQDPFGVVPRARADAVARIDCRLVAGRRGAEIRAPGAVARAGSARELLAVLVGASQAPKVGAVAGSDARD